MSGQVSISQAATFIPSEIRQATKVDPTLANIRLAFESNCPINLYLEDGHGLQGRIVKIDENTVMLERPTTRGLVTESASLRQILKLQVRPIRTPANTIVEDLGDGWYEMADGMHRHIDR